MRYFQHDRKVVAIQKTSALKLHGRLKCEGCGFDFAATYGARVQGFIEAHHANPVHAMQEGDVTTPDDLALICSNCHRMIYKAKPWLTVAELKGLLSHSLC
jgi:5-methylcytosine-specific restriction protein A